MMLDEQTLQELGKQFGLMMNWTNENAVPYLKDLAQRVVTYEIRQSIFWIVIGALLILLGIVICFLCFKTGGTDAVIVLFVCLILGVLIIGCQINDIILCKTIPEKIILQYIKN